MMSKSRYWTGALVGLALIGSSVTVAQARPRYGDWHHHHRHRDNGFGFGDALGVAALVGAVAIVANSMSKDRKTRDRRETDGWAERDGPAGRDDLALSGEDAAIDACAVAARDKAGDGSGYAEIRDISRPQPIEGGFNIDGTVEQRAGYRDSAGDRRRFTCTVRDGRVAEVYLSRDFVSN